MSMLGSSSSKKGFQGAASNVKAKSQSGSGLINLNKLKGIQNRKKGGFEAYKLNNAGLSRFRLVMPIGNDDTPLVSADQHWLPVTNDEGKVYRRPVFCYKQFGFSDCPICALQERLLAARDQATVASAEELRLVYRWAAYVVNRDYLAGSDDPEHDYDPRQDRIQLFSPISPKIADDIIAYLGKRTWGNASDPESGYDFEVEGEQTGKVFNGYKVTDYTVSPVPKDCSPAYSRELIRAIKPLSEVITYLKRPDLQKILDPILLSVSQDNEEAAGIIEGFTDYYNQLLDEIVAGPSAQLDADDYEQEQIQVTGDDSDEQAGDDTPHSGASESQSEEYESEPEEEADGDRESLEDSQSSGEDEEGIEESEEEFEEVEEEEPVAHPAPQVRPKPAGPLPAARPAAQPQTAKPSANAGLLGKLKQVGKH